MKLEAPRPTIDGTVDPTSKMSQVDNFCLPINLDRLQNDRVKLIPIENCTDNILQEYILGSRAESPELWRFMPYGPFETVEMYKTWHDQNIRHDTTRVIFAICLKAGKVTKRTAEHEKVLEYDVADDTFAGMTGLINASIENSCVELGHIMVLPKFHRTFVHSIASCLLLKHLLDPTTDGDLHLRRVQWQAFSINQPSILAAQRLGFTLEGIIRWQRVIPNHKECISEAPGERSAGKPILDVQGRPLGPGRHSAILSICWDDWLEGKRGHVLELLARP